MDDRTQPTFTGGELLAGKYRVECVIGEGGMGVVLAARHEALQTNVAIKLLRTNALGHTDVVGRFLREARAAVSLRSEHVARVFDVGNLDDGRPFIVMERLEGLDLGDVIEQTPSIEIGSAVDYVMQACEAIAEAHAAGIIHRDLKPKNLFLTHAIHGRPLVKVLDFGISKIATAPNELQLTGTTEVIGSPSYMSPEQLRSARNVDTRTDIWALGVILYELLTGRLPFNAETVTELVLVVVTEREPPVRSLRPEVPEGLAHVIERCLQKDPQQRFATVVDLVQALEPFAHGVQATITERVRAAAGHAPTTPTTRPLGSFAASPSGAALPPAPGTGSGPLPAAAGSSRVNVHGGTSVAWGETESLVGPSPLVAARETPPTKGSGVRTGLVVGVVAGLFLATSAVGGAVYFVTHAPVQPHAVAGDGSMPLPPGRKDLPPVSTTAQAPTATAPKPEPTLDTPVTSALPDTRKPPAPPPPVAKTPTNRGAKPDDLSNIGRR